MSFFLLSKIRFHIEVRGRIRRVASGVGALLSLNFVYQKTAECQVYLTYTDYVPYLTDHDPDTPLPTPTANAGPDQVVFNKVILDASLSTFIIGGTPSYHWELTRFL